MNPGDISVFVNAAGEKHVGVLLALDSDGNADICVLKATQRGVKLTATGEPGTFFDPTMPVDELPMREPAADDVAAKIPGSILTSVPPAPPTSDPVA